MKGQVEYKLVARFESENAIREIYRPVLEPDEYQRRFKRLCAAAEEILKEVHWPQKSINT